MSVSNVFVIIIPWMKGARTRFRFDCRPLNSVDEDVSESRIV